MCQASEVTALTRSAQAAKSRQRDTVPGPDQTTRLPTYLLVIISVLLGIGFYYRALIAVHEQYLALALVLPGAALLLGLAWPRLPRADWRTWALWISVGADLLALLTFANLEYALLGLGIKLAGVGLYLLAWHAGAGPQAVNRLSGALLAGMAVSLAAAYLILAGSLDFPAGMEGRRLSSTLQYPNTFGAVALAMALVAAVPAGARVGLTWRHPVVYLALLATVLPNSRGVWLVLPVVLLGLVLSLWRQAPHVPLVFAGHTLVALAAGVPLLQVQPPWGLAQWRIVLLGAAVSCTVIPLVEWGLRRRPALKWAVLVLGGALGLGAGVLFSSRLAGIVGRFLTIARDGGALARVQHLLDALVASWRVPLGAGYLGWQSIYQSHQSYGYTINILHSHPAEVLVSSGWLGLLALLALWAGLGYSYFKWLRRPESSASLTGHGLFWGLAALGLHGAGDVDFNYILLYWIAFAGWGLFHRLSAHAAPAPRRPVATTRYVVWGVGVVLGVMALLGYFANVAYRQSVALGQNAPEAALPLATRAAAMVSWSGEHWLQMAALWLTRAQQVGDAREVEAQLRQADQFVSRSMALHPTRPEAYNLRGRIYALGGELDKAAAAFEKAVALAPWRLVYWEDALEFRVESARVLGPVSPPQAQKQKQAAVDLLRRLDEQKQREPANTPAQFRFNHRTPRIQALIKQLQALK